MWVIFPLITPARTKRLFDVNFNTITSGHSFLRRGTWEVSGYEPTWKKVKMPYCARVIFDRDGEQYECGDRFSSKDERSKWISSMSRIYPSGRIESYERWDLPDVTVQGLRIQP